MKDSTESLVSARPSPLTHLSAELNVWVHSKFLVVSTRRRVVQVKKEALAK